MKILVVQRKSNKNLLPLIKNLVLLALLLRFKESREHVGEFLYVRINTTVEMEM